MWEAAASEACYGDVFHDEDAVVAMAMKWVAVKLDVEEQALVLLEELVHP